MNVLDCVVAPPLSSALISHEMLASRSKNLEEPSMARSDLNELNIRS